MIKWPQRKHDNVDLLPLIVPQTFEMLCKLCSNTMRNANVSSFLVWVVVFLFYKELAVILLIHPQPQHEIKPTTQLLFTLYSPLPQSIAQFHLLHPDPAHMFIRAHPSDNRSCEWGGKEEYSAWEYLEARRWWREQMRGRRNLCIGMARWE